MHPAAFQPFPPLGGHPPARYGPLVFSPSFFQNRTIAAAASAGGDPNGGFRWPRALFVTGVKLVPQSGDVADLADLDLQIQDESFADIMTSGLGNAFTMGGAAISGLVAFRAIALQRPVLDGDLWYFTVTNNGSGSVVLSSLLLYFDDGLSEMPGR